MVLKFMKKQNTINDSGIIEETCHQVRLAVSLSLRDSAAESPSHQLSIASVSHLLPIFQTSGKELTA
jgi:hypothetical protein